MTQKQLENDRELVEKLCDLVYGLSSRELDFVEDMARQVGEPNEPPEGFRPMSENQRAWAASIAERLDA
jgi:hypothetical protein